MQHLIEQRWGQSSDTRGDPAIVYLDGVQPPSPSSDLLTRPCLLGREKEGGGEEDRGGEGRGDHKIPLELGPRSPCVNILAPDQAPSPPPPPSPPASIELTMAELELLQLMEEANRLIESDSKSLNCLSEGGGSSRQNSSTSCHSRTSSLTSQMSVEMMEAGEDLNLWTTWGDILKTWDTSPAKKRQPLVKELVRRGIPHHFRGMAWQVLCGAHESSDKAKYSELMKTQSACEKVIRRDIARTYPEHDFFKKKDGVGQESLFNVMKAYSVHDREVGYCQGSAFIVGLLLMQMPEEESFAVVVKIMQDYRMREMFKPSMAELGLCMYQLDTLVQEHIPDLYVHFQSQAIHTNLYASSWFLTLFSTCFSLPLASRIMDCFLSEGMEVIFRIALALLLRGKQELLLQDMEGVLTYFQKDMPVIFESDPEAIFSLAFSLKINQKKMKKVEKEYTTMKCKEKEDEIEIRRLQNENRLLRQRIDLLENESNELADRLIQGQVDRAEVDETTFVMKRELAAVKQHDLDTNNRLEEALLRIKGLEQRMEKEDAELLTLEDLKEKKETIAQKEEMINCLKDELFKARLQESENEETIRNLRENISFSEQERKKLREDIPEHNVASLQEELAASKLRETEANLALKDLRTKVGELNIMWQKHLKVADGSEPISEMPSTPKKLLGSLLEGGWGGQTRREEELMTTRLREVEGLAELKELRLKIMGLETQTKVLENQLERQNQAVSRLSGELNDAGKREGEKVLLLKERETMVVELEGRLRENQMVELGREEERKRRVAELSQEVDRLEWQNRELQGDMEVEGKRQTINFPITTPDCTPLVEYKHFIQGYK